MSTEVERLMIHGGTDQARAMARIPAALLLLVLIAGRARSEVPIAHVAAVDVTPSEFSVVWESQVGAAPAIAVYADPEGTVEVTSGMEVVWHPLQGGNPAVLGEREQEAALEAIRARARDRGLWKVRVAGCSPETTYHFRLTMQGAGGEESRWPEASLSPVTTAVETSFVVDARQLLVDITGLEAPGDATAWIVIARHSQVRHGTSTLVSDGAASHQAYLSLANLFGQNGRNWSPAGEEAMDLLILRGLPQDPLESRVRVAFRNEFAVASVTTAAASGVTPADTDRDGLADSWENENFGDLSRDGRGDFDGDGLSELFEYQNGANPKVSNLPVLPQILAPETGAEVDLRRPELVVHTRSLTPFLYEIELYSDEGLLDLLSSAEVVSAGSELTWTAPLDLDENSWHHLRVRSSDGFSYSEWVYTTFFVNSANDPPEAPGISSPAGGSEVDTGAPLLEVTNGRDADGDRLEYSFEVFSDAQATQRVASTAGVEEGRRGTTSFTVAPALIDGRRYYWRAAATDEEDAASTSALASFLVNLGNRAPPAPVLLSPLEGARLRVREATITVENVADPEGGAVTYHFEIDTAATFDGESRKSSGPVAAGPGTSSARFLDLADDTRYHVRVKAADGARESAWTRSSFFVDALNEPPSVPTVNNPGQAAWVGTVRPLLSVNASRDPDGDAVTYRFDVFGDDLLSRLVAQGESAAPEWVVPQDLESGAWYYWRAQAADPHGAESGWMAPALFLVNTRVQEPPHAAAGPDRNARVGTAVVLDGTDSRDPLKRLISFSWTFLSAPPGSAVAAAGLTDPASPKPSFTPDLPGTYLLRLEVENGVLADLDLVSVLATAPGSAPNAEAGPPRTVLTGSLASLDGGASGDPDAAPGPLTYLWSFSVVPEKSSLSSADFQDRDRSAASFRPDVDGLYLVRLLVSDGESTAQDTVAVLAGSAGVAPNADAGTDLIIERGETASLDGSSSGDPDHAPGPLSHAWRFSSLPAESRLTSGGISGRDAARASFIPDAGGTYLLELEVTDGLYRVTDNVAVTVEGEAQPRFIRSDVDANGASDITDAINCLNYQFLGAAPPTCKETLDADDTGAVDVTDGIYILNFLFLGGPLPPAPYPACGPDPTGDGIGCESFGPCE